eukprot:TRINITY_DN91430_c0_g1_i1.p1 TRINITY_DN91430_c0_g1~~TRINITY_DN91430_c0_g1_i1.p1  ORF type:complete len:418 (+),score=60.88 TRINITY_DN91430_c0_g1_i1:29-1282(+)
MRPDSCAAPSDELLGLSAGAVAPKGELSTFGAFLILTKINWGIGMVAMPFYLHTAGLWFGLSFFVVSMVLAGDAALCLARCRTSIARCSAENTFAGLIGSLLGRPGQMAAIFSLALANYGSCIGWTKYIGDNLARFLPEVGMSSAAWSCMLTAPLLLCSLIEDVSLLGKVSWLGLAASQAFAVLLVAQALLHAEQLLHYFSAQPVVCWSTAPVAMGLAVFCNEGMCVVTPSVHASMCEPRRISLALLAMVIYFTVNYMAVAIAGDFLFSYLPGNVVSSEVSLSFGVTPLYRVAVYLYIVQLLLSYPIVLFTVFSSVEATLLPSLSVGARRSIRALLIAVMGGISILVPRFGDFLAVAGAVANSLGIYILPHASLLVAEKRHELKLGLGRRVCSWLVLAVFGIAAGSVSSVISLSKLL